MNVEALTTIYQKMLRAEREWRHQDAVYWKGYAECYIDQNAMTDGERADAWVAAKTFGAYRG